MRKQQTLNLFKVTFGGKPDVYTQAPGRLEVLGNHTDYNEGFVLSTAVDRYTSIAAREIDGNICRVLSPSIEKVIRTFSLDDLTAPLPGNDWINYVRGILLEFQKRNFHLRAFEAVITSDVPLSAGMSSSASLEMALATALQTLFGLDVSKNDLAKIGQGCENNYIGANTGLMDQFTSLNGQKNAFVLSEYRNLNVENIAIPNGLVFVVVNSGVKHDLSQEYNKRRESCEKAAAALGIAALRDSDLTTLLDSRAELPETVFKRALHVVSENERVHSAVKHLKNNDLKAFGALLFESHQSSIDNFENSCPELDRIIETARRSPYCQGARLSGGGFGGITIHMVLEDVVEEYCQYLKNELTEPEIHLCKSADGAKAELLK